MGKASLGVLGRDFELGLRVFLVGLFGVAMAGYTREGMWMLDDRRMKVSSLPIFCAIYIGE